MQTSYTPRRIVTLMAMIVTAVLFSAGSSRAQIPYNVFLPLSLSDSAKDDPFRSVELVAPEASIASDDVFWTAERMAEAQPLSETSALSDAQEAALAEQLDALDARYQRVDASASGTEGGGLPDPIAAQQARSEFPDAWLSPDDNVDDFAPAAIDGTPSIYTLYLGNYYSQSWKSYPYTAIGKLYFSAGYCTASVIRPGIIVTAAHCVYDTSTNRWYSNFRFVPAERNGTAPYGSFSWTNVRILNGYINLSDWSVSGGRYDVAVINLANNSAGRPVNYYTGYLGSIYGQGYVRNVTEIGYPSNLTNGRWYTYISHAESYQYSTDVLGYGGRSGPGASGSPSMLAYAPFQAGNINLVNGVASGVNLTSRWMTAARFTATNFRDLCNASGCGIP